MCWNPETFHFAVPSVGFSEGECITGVDNKKSQFILYLDEKSLASIDVEGKQNQTLHVTSNAYRMKKHHVLALKNTAEQKGQEADSLEQV